MSMKRTVFCLCFPILFLLLLCTALALKVQDEMQIQVEVKTLTGSNPKRNSNIPYSALNWGGKEQLYCIVEGRGWESGQRVAEIAPQNYSVVRGFNGARGHAILGPGTEYTLILSACRPSERGSQVEIVEEFITGEDVYLIWCPDGIERIEMLPNVLEPITVTPTGILANMKKAKMPFFEMKIQINHSAALRPHK